MILANVTVLNVVFVAQFWAIDTTFKTEKQTKPKKNNYEKADSFFARSARHYRSSSWARKISAH
jgi:hypothetical protein